MALSSQLQNQVRNYFSRSSYFDSNDSLRRLFIDQRISLWRSNIPEAGSRAGRISAIIAQFDTMNGEYNTLALIIQVISDNTPHGDAMKSEGIQLAQQVQAGSTASKQAEYERELAQLEEHFQRKWTDAVYYNKRKPQLLQLIAQFDSPTEIVPDNSPPTEQMRQAWIDEFAECAKALVQAQAVYEVYVRYGVDNSGPARTITEMNRRCADLADKINK